MKKIFLTIFFCIFAFSIFSQQLAAPILSVPSEGYKEAMPNQIFTWKSVPSVESVTYIIQWADNENFNNYASAEIHNGVNYKASNLIWGQKYYWRVKAKTSIGESEYSIVRSFTVLDKLTVRQPNQSIQRDSLSTTIGVSKFYGTGNDRQQLVAFEGIELWFSDDSEFSEEPNFTTYKEIIYKSEISDKYTIYRLRSFKSLKFNATYYLKLRVYNINEQDVEVYSSWTDVTSFTINGIPRLRAPRDGREYDMVSPMTWDNIKGTLKYEVEIATDASFTNASSYSTVAANLTPDNLKFGETYFWRVKAVASNESDYSEVWSFTTPSQIPVLISPENNVQLKANPVYFVWKKIDNVDGYVLELIDQQTNKVNKTIIRGDTITSISKYLEFEKEFKWNIRGFFRRDTTERSENRLVKVLFTEPVLSFPSRDLTVINPVTVRWEILLGADGYEILYADDADFTKNVSLVNINNPNQTSVEILFDSGREYYLKIRAKSGDLYSEYNLARNFHVSIGQPQLISPLNPSDYESAQAISPVIFEWSRIYGVTDYLIEYSTYEDFSDLRTINVTMTDEVGKSEPIALSEGLYYWRVQGITKNDDGTIKDKSIYSLVSKFMVVKEWGVDNIFKNSLSVYPNPCTDNVTITGFSSDDDCTVSIMDITGKILITKKVVNPDSESLKIDISSLNSGIYFIKADSSKNSFTTKFLKK